MITLNTKALRETLKRLMTIKTTGASYGETLQSVHLRAAGGSVSLRRTDLDQWLTLTVPTVDPCDPVDALLPDSLYRIVQKLKGETVTLTPADGAMIVESGPVRVTLPLYDLEEYPEQPSAVITELRPVLSELDTAMALRVTGCASDNAARLALHALQIDPEALVCTDGHRLNVAPVTAQGEALLALPAVRVLAKCAPVAEIVRDDRHAFAYFEGGNLQTRIVDAEFPQWRRVMPSNLSGSLTVQADDLRECIDVGRAVVNSDHYAGVKFRSGPEGITATMEDDRAESTMALEGTCSESAEIRGGFNHRYVLDAIAGNRDEVVMSFDPQAPGLGGWRFSNPTLGEGGYTVVMPLRV